VLPVPEQRSQAPVGHAPGPTRPALPQHEPACGYSALSAVAAWVLTVEGHFELAESFGGTWRWDKINNSRHFEMADKIQGPTLRRSGG